MSNRRRLRKPPPPADALAGLSADLADRERDLAAMDRRHERLLAILGPHLAGGGTIDGVLALVAVADPKAAREARALLRQCRAEGGPDPGQAGDPGPGTLPLALKAEAAGYRLATAMLAPFADGRGAGAGV